jgi:serine/threonine protein phosphatase PrpC
VVFSVTVAAQSDPGCLRANNEDYFGYDTSRQLYAVCDGMGGHVGGEIASKLAIQTLLSADSPKVEESPSAPKELVLYNLVLAAHQAVREATRNDQSLRGMGTTLVAAYLDDQRLLIANVGDSRAYMIRDGGCAQLTTDHSFIEEQIKAGTIKRENARNSPAASVITRAVGTEEAVKPDLFSLELVDKDIVLLATDGLAPYATPQELAEIIKPDCNLRETCAALINLAKSLGAADNVTCLLLRFRALQSTMPASANQAQVK